MEIPVPFLPRPVGAGDALKTALSAVGIQQKRGCGCKARQEAMNQKLQFVPTAQHPAKTSIWDTLPAAPEGWERAAGCDTTLLFHKLGTDQHVVWNVTAGRFHDAHAFCCDAAKAQEEYAARCR